MFMDLLVEAGSLTPEMELISQKFPIHSKLMFLVAETMSLEPEPTKLISLVRKIFSLAISKNSKLKKLTSLCPQAQVTFKEGIIHVIEEVLRPTNNKWKCLPLNWQKFRQPGAEGYTHFFCEACNAKTIKNITRLHFIRSIYLSLSFQEGALEPENAIVVINILEASLTCSLCALTHSSCPLYICPPCDFVVHQRKIDNDNGSYSCIKDGCSYVAHSKCATQINVWDGVELEREPEEVEPFVTISDGILQHFSHQHHYMRIDDNTARDYDENKMCQACILPVYIGNFYSCMQCDFILHEECAKLSRKIHHPIHPHLLTLVSGNDGVMDYHKDTCSACPWFCKAGFFYECRKEGCRFMLHVQCATISEPLVHTSHLHPLFLTSKPGEKQRSCSLCKELGHLSRNETFNCIECDYFALCFKCATLPHKVRYKYDKHMRTLSYGDDTSTTTYWCEVCEGKINPKERF
ncbi:DC1 [Arabidopsis thaliana x Arabidopsis arenosa]|uniref:DC1 n=1 Tax=Arabidopsis thaliana x Arabidopsis arenosa TaxID=1240361 RepID=A0A8T1ZKJ6_9BRAS|nr:DC1 [Arabidopsis thaliana x Arabidopsis arenosa]